MNDENVAYSLEIAESHLEEKAVITEKGFVKNYYKNAKDPNVSKEAFNVSKEAFKKFESMITDINKLVESGEIAFGNSLLDVKDSEPVKEDTGVVTNAVYSISHEQSAKAQKLILAGAGVALLAAELGVPVVVASGLALLAAATGLCDWNNKGFYLIKYGPYYSNWTCVPK